MAYQPGTSIDAGRSSFNVLNGVALGWVPTVALRITDRLDVAVDDWMTNSTLIDGGPDDDD